MKTKFNLLLGVLFLIIPYLGFSAQQELEVLPGRLKKVTLPFPYHHVSQEERAPFSGCFRATLYRSLR
jgi:hypothetical protein